MSGASVTVEGETVGSIGPGLVVLIGVASSDDPADADYLANKIANLRIFSDDDGRFNLSALDLGAELLIVSRGIRRRGFERALAQPVGADVDSKST